MSLLSKIGLGLVIFIIIIFTLGATTDNSPRTTRTNSVVNKTDGYKLAFIDSKDISYAEANGRHYDRLMSNIRGKCILDDGQKISDLLVVTQRIIKEDTGREFQIADLAIVIDERLSLGGEKVRCDEYMVGIATIIDNNL